MFINFLTNKFRREGFKTLFFLRIINVYSIGSENMISIISDTFMFVCLRNQILVYSVVYFRRT